MRNLESLCPRSYYGERACSIALLTQLVPIVEHESLLSQNDAPGIFKKSAFILVFFFYCQCNRILLLTRRNESNSKEKHLDLPYNYCTTEGT